jgi:hypothetical protein
MELRCCVISLTENGTNVMAKKPRVAYCLYGLSGGAKGKDGKGSDPEIFRLGHKHANKYILSKNNMDVFMHTWSVEYEEELKNLYKPVKAAFEPQVYFDVPTWIQGGRSSQNHESDGLNAHYSRWYSTKRVLELKKQYEKENGFKYDFVMITRFDIAWRKKFIFSQLSPDKFYACRYCHCISTKKRKMSVVKYWHNRDSIVPGTKLEKRYRNYPKGKSRGLWDVWFIGSSGVMDSFATIYDDLEKYCKDPRMNKKLKGQKKRKIVLSHHLVPLLWLENNKWLSKIELFMDNVDDCAPVRMWYKQFHEGKHYA